MKRSLHPLATVLGPAFAVDVPRATAASVDAVRVIGQREFGLVIRPPAAIPNPSGRPNAGAASAMRATEQHVREFLEWKDRHAPSSGRVGGSLR
jgi:hypothetical protein